MKAILLATALAFGGTAVAQDMTTPPPPPVEAPMPPDAPMAPDAPMPPAAPMPAQTMPPPAGAPMAPQMTSGDDPVGGYQPSAPPMSMPAAPGQQVIFQPSVSPAQAFPPPAPLESYPICKRGQYDNCRQRGG